MYTWYASVQTVGERVRLYVDNSLLVEQWTSLAATEASGTLSMLVANGYLPNP